MYSNYTTQSSHSPDNSVQQRKGWLAEILKRQSNDSFHDPHIGTSYGSNYNQTYYMDPQSYSSSPQCDYMPHYQSYESPNYYIDDCQHEPPIDFSSSQFLSSSGQPNYTQSDFDNSFDPSPSESNGLTQINYMDSSFNFPNDSHNDDPSLFSHNYYDQTSLASKLQDLVRGQQTLIQSMNQTEHNILIQQMEESNNQILESSARMTHIFNEIQESLDHSPIPSSFDYTLTDDTYREFDNSSSAPTFVSSIMLPEPTDQLLCSHDPEYIHYNENEEVFPLHHDDSYISPLLEKEYYEDNLYEEQYISFHQSIIPPLSETNNYEDECHEDEKLIELSAENIMNSNHDPSLESINHQLDLIHATLGPHYIHDMHILPVDTYLAHDPYLRAMSHQHSYFSLPKRTLLFDALLKTCAQSNSIFVKAEKFKFSNFSPCYIFSSSLGGTCLNMKNIFIIILYVYIPPPGDFPLFLLVYDVFVMHH